MEEVWVAGDSNWEETTAFLERKGLAENAFLLMFADNAFRYPSGPNRVMLCRRDEELVGVAVIADYEKAPPLPKGERAYGYQVEMDCADRGAVEALLEALPSGRVGLFRLMRPVVQEYFDLLPGVQQGRAELFFTVSTERFRPVSGEQVIELTAADSALFEGTERAAKGRVLASLEFGSRVFAILRNGKVATSASSSPFTPDTETKRGAISIGGVFTEPQHRNMSLGKRLVSHMTELILREGHVPIYWTDPDNLASQALAKGLGYWQYGAMITYLWRKP